MTSTYQGRFLLGAPDLEDPNFFRSVVLLVDHSESGALGVILNRPTDTTLSRVWREVSEEPCLREAFLHAGGPCEGLLSALHTDADSAQMEVCDGLYFTAEAPLLAQLVEDDHAPVDARFFVGYAGWGPEQLEMEVEHGGWLLTPRHEGRRLRRSRNALAEHPEAHQPELGVDDLQPRDRPRGPVAELTRRWLLAAGHWPLAAGHWPLATDHFSSPPTSLPSPPAALSRLNGYIPLSHP